MIRLAVAVGGVVVFGVVLAFATVPHTATRTDLVGTEFRSGPTTVEVPCNGRLFVDPDEGWSDGSPGNEVLAGPCELSETDSRGIVLALVLSSATLALVGLALAWRTTPAGGRS